MLLDARDMLDFSTRMNDPVQKCVPRVQEVFLLAVSTSQLVASCCRNAADEWHTLEDERCKNRTAKGARKLMLLLVT